MAVASVADVADAILAVAVAADSAAEVAVAVVAEAAAAAVDSFLDSSIAHCWVDCLIVAADAADAAAVAE